VANPDPIDSMRQGLRPLLGSHRLTTYNGFHAKVSIRFEKFWHFSFPFFKARLFFYFALFFEDLFAQP
jgi:hypothetical protein